MLVGNNPLEVFQLPSEKCKQVFNQPAQQCVVALRKLAENLAGCVIAYAQSWVMSIRRRDKKRYQRRADG